MLQPFAFRRLGTTHPSPPTVPQGGLTGPSALQRIWCVPCGTAVGQTDHGSLLTEGGTPVWLQQHQHLSSRHSTHPKKSRPLAICASVSPLRTSLGRVTHAATGRCPQKGWCGAVRNHHRSGIPVREWSSCQRQNSCAGVSPCQLRRSRSEGAGEVTTIGTGA